MLLQHAKAVWPANQMDICECPFCHEKMVLIDALDAAQSFDDKGVQNVGHYIGHQKCILQIVQAYGGKQ